MKEQEEKIEQLAKDTLALARNTLLVHLRFLDMALSMQEPVFVPGIRGIATDGMHLFNDPLYVLRLFRSGRGCVSHAYLHLVLHCVFRHMAVGGGVDRRLWDLACDVAVESVIDELSPDLLSVKESEGRRAESKRLAEEIGGLTAERIYRFLSDAPLDELSLQTLECLFAVDTHDVWYNPKKYGAFSTRAQEEEDAQWKRIAERMQEDLETFSVRQGNGAGNLMQSLREINRERYDYTAFLKRFAVPAEVMRVNDDEFDYLYYTYGLTHYERMPLIEPLEYKDEKRIKEFVIAIDTSGSVSGELVQTFVQKTYNVLKSTESFSTKINLHIIQCDAVIQEDVRITSQEEFDAYLAHMRIRGLGGTDFRPVFSYVNRLCEEKEFTNLKGLIYFTDGYGDFPAQMPPYATAFIFIDDALNNPDVPPWAIKLVLRKDEV